jgi:SWI/SNF-related matrix-associated actin-dependent regulator 1 of chromatin subfamily A
VSIFDSIDQQVAQVAQSTAASNQRAAAAAASFRARSDAMARTENWDLCEPEGIDLYGFQAAAVETILMYGRALLGFAPGMGKTVTALTALATDQKRAIIVCPPSLRLMWIREIARLFPQLASRVHTVTGTKPKAIDTNNCILVVGDSVVAKRLEDLQAWGAEALYLDEAHRIKNNKANRTKAVLALADSLPMDATIVGLTGTLSVNRPDESWAPIRMTGVANARAVSGGSSFTNFVQRCCETQPIRVAGGRIINNVVGCTDAVALHEALRSQVYVRVEREDVLDMPDKVWKITDLILNGDFKVYQEAESDFINWIADTKGDKAAHRAAKAEAIVKLNALRELAGECKIKTAAVEYITDLTDQDEQVVVMAHNRSVVQKLAGKLQAKGVDVAMIYGGMSDTAKANAEADFRDGSVQVLVANIDSAGVGLNLDTAANLVFVQLPWSPGALQQAADRIYRLTQKRNCTIHVLNAMGSVDERMWGILQAKAEVVDAINAGMPCTLPTDSVYTAVLEDYGW